MKQNLIIIFIFFLCTTFSYSQQKDDELTFHKEFLGNGVNSGNSIVEFRLGGVFINGKQKAFYKTEGSDSFLLARYSDFNQTIYLLVTDIAQGTCGFNTFTIVTIDDFENVKAYNPSPRVCSGEIPATKFYISDEKGNPFLIDVGYELQFNLTTAKWTKLIKAKK